MVFRVKESASNGFESVKNYFVSREIDEADRKKSEQTLYQIRDRYGPVVDRYPSWHPLVKYSDESNTSTIPSYDFLDHSRYFVNAIVTCPYDNAQKIVDAINGDLTVGVAVIRAEILEDVQLYHEDATPILISCDWDTPLNDDNMIPAKIALPLMLMNEVPCWTWATHGETWETMRPYFLGEPHGKRSSHFINQTTGSTMKKVWNQLINTGMFGPIKVSNQS